MENNLLNPNQLGSMPGDSCIQQLISITYEIYMAFLLSIPHKRLEVFFRYTKAFYQVWHEGLIYKAKCMAAKADLLTLIESFLCERQQGVVLNGQESDYQTWYASVQFFGPLFF